MFRMKGLHGGGRPEGSPAGFQSVPERHALYRGREPCGHLEERSIGRRFPSPLTPRCQEHSAILPSDSPDAEIVLAHMVWCMSSVFEPCASSVVNECPSSGGAVEEMSS